MDTEAPEKTKTFKEAVNELIDDLAGWNEDIMSLYDEKYTPSKLHPIDILVLINNYLSNEGG